MTTPTTIKVPRDLRDRIAARAKQEGTTLAAAIAHALDVSEEEAFWSRVAADNARSSSGVGTSDYDEGGLRDHLEQADDDLGRDGW